MESWCPGRAGGPTNRCDTDAMRHGREETAGMNRRAIWPDQTESAAGPAIPPAIAFTPLAVLTRGPELSTESTVVAAILVVPGAILIHAPLLIDPRWSSLGINPNAAGAYFKTLRKRCSDPAQHGA